MVNQNSALLIFMFKVMRPPTEAAYEEEAMEWFNRKTSIAGVQIPNWGIVLGAVIVILFIYSAVIH